MGSHRFSATHTEASCPTLRFSGLRCSGPLRLDTFSGIVQRINEITFAIGFEGILTKVQVAETNDRVCFCHADLRATDLLLRWFPIASIRVLLGPCVGTGRYLFRFVPYLRDEDRHSRSASQSYRAPSAAPIFSLISMFEINQAN